ncbi:MAG: hypothetical protein M5U25_21125 [Planctomycetota bacterium]|nr:hypothetical protein [Planctomycetota bacterium]
MAVSYTVDGTEVNGSGGRRLHGQITDIRTATTREISCHGILYASTTESLHERWGLAQQLFNKKDKRVTVKIDSTTESFLEDIFPGDGRTITLESYITGDITRIGTATSMPFQIVTTVSEVLPNITTGKPASPNQVKYKGQVGDWRRTITYNEARVQSRGYFVQFARLYDKEAYGSFNIVGVTNVGGYAVFELATAPPAYDAEKDQKLYVSGTTNYDTVHEITAIDVGNKKVTTTTPWSADETGTCYLGEATTPQELYALVRTDILNDQLGTGDDGERDATTGLVLTGETQGLEADILTVLLTSEWVEKNYDDDIRNLSIALSKSEAPDWPVIAGDAPVTMSAVVSFSVDKDQAAQVNPSLKWATIRSAVIADIKTNSELTDAKGPYEETIAFDIKTGVVTVNMSFLAKNTTVFKLSKVYHYHEELQYTTWKDFAGYDYIQTSSDPLMLIVTAAITRVGVGEVNLTADPPQQSGYTFIEVSRDDSREGSFKRRNIADDVVVQSTTIAWRRFRLRSGQQNPRVRNPVTGG